MKRPLVRTEQGRIILFVGFLGDSAVIIVLESEIFDRIRFCIVGIFYFFENKKIWQCLNSIIKRYLLEYRNDSLIRLNSIGLIKNSKILLIFFFFFVIRFIFKTMQSLVVRLLF